MMTGTMLLLAVQSGEQWRTLVQIGDVVVVLVVCSLGRYLLPLSSAIRR
jgi:hypothetical protein